MYTAQVVEQVHVVEVKVVSVEVVAEEVDALHGRRRWRWLIYRLWNRWWWLR